MREYRVWTREEEQCLRLGAAKHGSGAWELIRTDPAFHTTLCALSCLEVLLFVFLVYCARDS